MTPSFSPLSTQAAHMRDGPLFLLALTALLIALAWLGVSAFFHRRNLRALPIRVHVAGARGKSTVTRMIAAGLRADGLRVIAKATGSEPRLVLPDGAEEVWRRRGPASVREQIRFMARAARMGAQAVVVECMAVRPEFVWASESQLIRATVTVITNARPDHFEELGHDPQTMERALAFAIPAGGDVILSGEAATPFMLASAKARGCRTVIAPSDGLDPDQTNRAIALAACQALGVAHDQAEQAIMQAGADPGGFFRLHMEMDGARFCFVNAFACNDVASLARLWGRRDARAPATVLLNARHDRPLRTQEFLRFLAAQAARPRLFLSGDPLAMRLARRAGFSPGAIHWLPAGSVEEAVAALLRGSDAETEIWGIGNYHGLGRDMVAYARRSARTC